MAIGYYNFGNIQQGNQTVANSLASLGQQISGAIENHAQTQAAQAMLPSLQNQVQQGMSKIANGDSTGLGDVYGAAMNASQIPILAPMANHAVNMAQSANINAQHMLRTQAMLQGRMDSLERTHPGTYDENGNFIPATKSMTPFQQQSIDLKNAGIKAKQVGLYSNLWNGQPAQGQTPATPGASEAADNIQTAIEEDKPISQDDMRKFAGAYSQYKQTQAALGNAGIPDANFESAYQRIGDQLLKEKTKLGNHIATLPKGTDLSHVDGHNWPIIGIWGGKDVKTQQQNLDQAIRNFSALKNIGQQQSAVGGIPAAQAGQEAPVDASQIQTPPDAATPAAMATDTNRPPLTSFYR